MQPNFPSNQSNQTEVGCNLVKPSTSIPSTQQSQTSYELPPPSCCLCMTFGHEPIDCIEFPNLPESIQHQVFGKFSGYVMIAGEKIEYKKGYLLKDPHLVKKQDLMRYEINYEFLPPPTYFTNITDIIFNTDWKIADDNDEKMGHVLKRKDKRIKKEITISQLHTAITFSRKMAQRNYKYIVPMYYPEKNRIQLLMPLYFEGEYKDEPDGVLILTPDADTKFYVPETIIGLREAYMDARLISKPDNAWLEPSSLRKKENEN